MPIYEYRCERCGVFEHTQRITEPALQKCPTCRKKVTRLISSTSFHLKGSGWYVTDYARKSGNGGSSKESTKEAVKSESTGSESKADSTSSATSKPETKTSASGT